MCSIPGLPTPGSEVPVLITRVNLNLSCGLVELWVNLDDRRKHIYEQMRKDIQIPKRKFFRSEGKPGDLCLVCISDTWHRARIISSQSETCSVFLIDQGQPHITSSEALAWGKSECFLLPPEIESCILANVLSLENSWQERATKFLNSLPGKEFKGLVQHILMPNRIILLDIPTLSKHMCKCGTAKKISVDEFKCYVLECLDLPKTEASEIKLTTKETNLNVSFPIEKPDQYFYPELLTETFETVNVTEVINPQNIFCKLLIFSKALNILAEQIHQHYEESTDFGKAQAQTCGDPCAARGTNGRWHRSLLKQNMTSDGAIEIFHVDEGKTELVPVGDIKPLHGKFLRMPVVTYPCSLHGVKDNGRGWTTDETNYLKSLLLNKTLVARFEHHNIPQDVYYVSLCEDNDMCINHCFQEKAGLCPPSKTEQDSHVQNERQLAVNGTTDDVPTSGPSDIQIQNGSEHPDLPKKSNGHLALHSEMQSTHDNSVFTVGSTVNVKVPCIESLQKFWCQATENDASLRLLMEGLQSHYASTHPLPLVESVCVALNPNDNKWYRARIIASQHSPVVDVRFIDYGQTHKVPLRDVRPIDPAFLRLNAQAFQCCLFSPKNPTDPSAIPCTDVALTEFQTFVHSGASSNTGLKCIVKALMTDEEGLLLNVVDIETSSDSACKLLVQKCAEAEDQMRIPPQVPSDTYSYSTHNVEVGGEEEVWVTSSDNVNHFYCQLGRNLHLLEKVMENVQQLIGQPQCTDHPLGLNSICFARYTDNQWYRGQIVEMSPEIKVHFVDYGHTLVVNESDICPFAPEANIALSVPVQAVPLGLFDVPEEVPEEVSQWFADNAIGHSFTISVVTKGENGKLIVELFDGSLNVNKTVREGISQMTQQKSTDLVQHTDHQHSNSSNEECLMLEPMIVSGLTKLTEQNKVHGSNVLKMSSQSICKVSSPEFKHQKTLDEVRKTTLDVIYEDQENLLADTFIQNGHSDSEVAQLSPHSCPKGNETISTYKRPNISLNKTEEVYASCIIGPHYFWCQYTHTEDLKIMSKLAQEVGQAQQDLLEPKTLDPGSPCLALFSSDSQWYRAQVIQRTDNTLRVVFIDYGNESDVDIKDVRSLPQSLLEEAPHAFLCSLNGFDETKGSWDDAVYDDFYNLLVDKPLRVTVFNMEDHSELVVPQYAVQIESKNRIVNDAMLKYWKPVATEHVMTKNPQTENLLQEGQTESTMTHLDVSKGNVKTAMYKNPNISKNRTESVYASCIVGPNFFWCQYANTEELNKISRLVEKAGHAQQDMVFPKTLGPGSPCLALFSSDQQWYRAQVTHRADDAFHVLFVDYGNESDVDIKNVRSLPQNLMEEAPQAFLCSLNGFDETRGSWTDEVYDDFYNLLINKPLKLSIFNKEDHSEVAVPQYAVEIECEGVVVNAAMRKYWKPVAKERVFMESPQTETFLQDGQTDSNMMHLSVSKGNVKTGMYMKPYISKNKTELVYASCIVAPNFFWCQYVDTEELKKVTRLAQEAGQAQQDMAFPKTLGPGSPCLALFSSDQQWYRAQVIHRADDAFHVVFIDYGNESDVDIKDVRPLPESVLEEAPLAFLCSLNGFDETRGSWDDEAYDDFYNLLVDKPLKLTVFNIAENLEIAVPQHAVQIECEGAAVNTLMEKYWKVLDTDHALA